MALESAKGVGEGLPGWHSSVSPSSGKMVIVGWPAEEVGPMAGRSVWEPFWGVLMEWEPGEEEEVGLDRGRSWTTVWSLWKPRPTLRGMLKMTQYLRVDPSSGKRAGLFYPSSQSDTACGRPQPGAGTQSAEAIPENGQWLNTVSRGHSEQLGKWVLHSWWETDKGGTSHNRHLSPNNKGSFRYHLSTRVSPDDFCEKVFLWNII